MLTLVLGKAGSGKTAFVIDEIKKAVDTGRTGQILIVPEQYSHEAERELASVCGDRLSLCAEVLSFTALARKLAEKMGGAAAPLLDKGGRLLCMTQALAHIGSRLKVYSTVTGNSDLQDTLLQAIDELKSACIGTDRLYAAAGLCSGGLGDKLQDLALIAEAYDAVVANGHADPADRLTVLARQIREGGLDSSFHIYVDGFLDFTAQQREILRAMLSQGVQLTVCLTLDHLDGRSEIFQLSRREGSMLLRTAQELGQEFHTVCFEKNTGKADALAFFSEKMFDYDPARYEGNSSAVKLYSTSGMSAECELAAARCMQLVREEGCRWRDIAVAVRGYDEYRGTLNHVFSHYGIPLFAARMSQLPEKPLPLMIALTYELPEGGWDIDDMISYLHTGLSGLSRTECDLLEAYVFKWQLRGSAWERSWGQHPDGFGAEDTEESRSRLAEINRLRRKLAEPLLQFQAKSRLAETARQQAQALADLFARIQLPQILQERANALTEEGRDELASEYHQLWEIVVSALEQCAAILADTPMDRVSFGRLFVTMLSKYDVGSIPVSLDRVSAGDFDRMRRRSIRHLIVLGADENHLPRIEEGGGVFSQGERQQLLELDMDLGGGGEWELWREYALIYNVLTLPSESLCLCTSENNSQGESCRPAYVYRRAQELFALEPEKPDMDEIRCTARAPALSVAARAIRGADGYARTAEAYFRAAQPERFAFLERAAQFDRGRLSADAVQALYGSKLNLSASRIDKFAECKFAYFCRYGLNAKPYEPAGFKPPEIGVFMHYVLENTVREVQEAGGFRSVDDTALRDICQRWVTAFIHTKLNDFREKSSRFVYLFRRTCLDVYQVTLDMARELRNSDFVPLSFELDFSKSQIEAPAALLGENSSLKLTGIADRVDGWLHEGKLYLRVVDYKTGKKQFSLSDLWYGMGLQMLLYLFALQQGGKALYGHEIVPAGVMYVPARNALLNANEDMEEDDIEKKRLDQLRRSGIVLDDEDLIRAWENTEDKRFIPVMFTGRNKGEGLVTAERMGLLAQRIQKTLQDMALELRTGNISADPYYKSQQENACALCDYQDACHFVHGENSESCRFLTKLNAEEVWSRLEGGADNG